MIIQSNKTSTASQRPSTERNERPRGAHPTRELVVRVAMKLFSDKGYDSTSIADILQQANVNSGSLYHHFDTKQGVLIAVLEMYRDGIEHMLIAPAWEGVTDPIERVFALLARYREALRMTDCAYGCPIGSLALEIHEPDPPVRALLAENFENWTSFIQGCFDAARDRLPAGTDTRALAQFALTTMEGGVMLSRTYRKLDAFDAAVATLRNFISLLEGSAGKELGAVGGKRSLTPALSQREREKRGRRIVSTASKSLDANENSRVRRKNTKKRRTK